MPTLRTISVESGSDGGLASAGNPYGRGLNIDPRCRSVGIVVPSFSAGGGISETARFLHRILGAAPDFTSSIISVASSWRDTASVRIAAPRSWLGGPKIEQAARGAISYQHVGALFSEFEFQRYRPRRVLTDVLERFDLVQVVSGSPALCLAAREVSAPVALLTASLASIERETKLGQGRGVVNSWRRGMTRLTSSLDHEALSVADTIFVLNSELGDRLSSIHREAHVVVAPPGVDTDVFSPSPKLADATWAGCILSVGRFDDPRKDVCTLFDAYARLRAGYVEAPPLVLVGRTGPTPQDWGYAQEIGIREHVKHLSNVSKAELANLYRHAALMVLSSREEGLGIVLLEAMSSGIPVVATATAGARSVVDDGVTGVLVEIGNSSELADRVARLVHDQDTRRQMGARARTAVEREHSVEAAERVFLETYRQLLSRASAHA